MFDYILIIHLFNANFTHISAIIFYLLYLVLFIYLLIHLIFYLLNYLKNNIYF